MQEFKFSYKFIRIAPRKVRLVTNFAKSFSPAEALTQLKFLNKDAAKPVYELIASAVNSCKVNNNIDIKDLRIKSLTCDGGPTLKRRQFKSRGRASLIHKRSSHINLVLESVKTEVEKKLKPIKAKIKNTEKAIDKKPTQAKTVKNKKVKKN